MAGTELFRCCGTVKHIIALPRVSCAANFLEGALACDCVCWLDVLRSGVQAVTRVHGPPRVYLAARPACKTSVVADTRCDFPLQICFFCGSASAGHLRTRVCEICASTRKGLGNAVHAGKGYATLKGLLRRTSTKVQTGWLAANCSTRQKLSLLYLSYSSPHRHPCRTEAKALGTRALHACTE